MNGDSILHPNTEKLQSFVEGILGEGERAVLESHIMDCPTCQTEVEEWRSLFTVLATLPQYSPSIHFADNIMASVKLPDPWYVRALVKVGDRVQVFAPKTTRGWALATACLAVPFAVFAVLATWLLSKPYMTPSNVFAFVTTHAGDLVNNVAQVALAQLLQTDLALFVARQMEALSAAGIGAAGALLAAVAVATAGSAYVLYQNLFRANAHRNERYASYSF
ncbi:MAG TPA: zf-HC2 domain-containing protein [Longimicrobiales bacterium]|nr:zf-HC2 domain-containing protein [Longimicrobiales bacterium]